jgi:hypothetical protein
VLSVGASLQTDRLQSEHQFWRAMDNMASEGSIVTTLRPWLIREPVAMPVPAPISIAVAPGFSPPSLMMFLNSSTGSRGR